MAPYIVELSSNATETQHEVGTGSLDTDLLFVVKRKRKRERKEIEENLFVVKIQCQDLCFKASTFLDSAWNNFFEGGSTSTDRQRGSLTFLYSPRYPHSYLDSLYHAVIHHG